MALRPSVPWGQRWSSWCWSPRANAARRPVSIALRESVSDLDSARLARLAADGRADVIVELGWRTPQHDHVTIQLHARDGQQLRASELDFVGSAPRPERGRAVGFAIATMLDDEPIAASILAATSLPVSVVAATPAETPEPPAEPAQPAMTSAPAREPDRASVPPRLPKAGRLRLRRGPRSAWCATRTRRR